MWLITGREDAHRGLVCVIRIKRIVLLFVVNSRRYCKTVIEMRMIERGMNEFADSKADKWFYFIVILYNENGMILSVGEDSLRQTLQREQMIR